MHVPFPYLPRLGALPREMRPPLSLVFFRYLSRRAALSGSPVMYFNGQPVVPLHPGAQRPNDYLLPANTQMPFPTPRAPPSIASPVPKQMRSLHTAGLGWDCQAFC